MYGSGHYENHVCRQQYPNVYVDRDTTLVYSTTHVLYHGPSFISFHHIHVHRLIDAAVICSQSEPDLRRMPPPSLGLAFLFVFVYPVKLYLMWLGQAIGVVSKGCIRVRVGNLVQGDQENLRFHNP